MHFNFKYPAIFALLLFALSTRLPASDTYAPKSALSFQENKGQIHDQNHQSRNDIRFAGSDGRLNFFLKAGGVEYQQIKPVQFESQTDKITGLNTEVPSAMAYFRTDIAWVNSNPNMRFESLMPNSDLMHFYLDACPNGALNVKSYQKVQYRNLYQGIDVLWYFQENGLKYDYILAPGADYRAIQMEIQGYTSITVDASGALRIHTPMGILSEDAPLVKQGNKILPARWKVSANRVSFEIDGVQSNETLIIDPAVRIWGTYYGASAIEQIRGGASDSREFMNVVGYTTTTTGTLFASTGAHQGTFGGSLQDAIIAQFDSTGQRVWGTYLGGTQADEALACATDAQNNLYVTGYTRSSTTPAVFASISAHQTTHGGGADDIFLIKFNPNGIRLWGTFYGDQSEDDGHACAVDPNDNPFLVGFSRSTMNIATTGAHQTVHAGDGDVIIVKFDTAGVRQWATYYGGPKVDRPYACAADHLGNIYVTGNTDSITNHSGISTPGSHQPNPGGGVRDAFLLKMDGNGVRQWSTFYGGSNEDEGRACAVDASGNVYLGGHTRSATGIATPGAHQTTYYATRDAYVAKFNASGNRLWATYYGGGLGEWMGAMATDAAENLFFAGSTTSTDSISTPGAFQTAKVSVQDDAFLIMMDSSGVRQWGTYHGDVEQDAIYACSTTPSNHLYIAGTTQAVSNIATTGTHQTTYGGGMGDGFVARFYVGAAPAPSVSITSNSPVCTGDTLTLTATGPTGATYQWAGPGGFTASGNPAVLPSPSPSFAGVYTVTATVGSNTYTATHTVVIHMLPSVAISPSGTLALCQGDSAVINATGAISYLWNTNAITAGILVTAAGTYSVTGTDANGCSRTSAPLLVTVNPIPATPVISGQNTVPINQSVALTASGSTGTYSWWDALTGGTQLGTGANYTTPNLTVTTTFYAEAQDLGCTSPRDSFTVTVLTNTSAQALWSGGTFPEVQVFPSPLRAGQQLMVKIQGLQTSDDAIVFTLYSLQGQELQQHTLQTSGLTDLQHTFTFAQNPPAGVYLLEMQYQGQVRFHKWTVE